ncbi:MAG: amidohydrolase family protein, partial [Spirochaetales bacterium]|nr:amidohydrolase family protein [Spirochaetales bacterium]
GQLTVRIYIYPGTNHQADKIHEILPYKELFYSDEMHITGVKGILDGVTATYTAVMTEPYQDNPGVNGILVVDKDTIQNWVSTANANGLSCRIHCIGDGAVREALDAYEASNAVNDNSNIRNGVEHIEMLHPDDVNRFHELGVVASMQPRHQILDKGEKLFRCGLERSKYEWNFKAIRDTKGRIALGTDYPVVSFNPYENIYIGMTTRSLDGVQFGTTTREQVLTLEECLKGYTIEGAYLNSMEQKVGTLEPGKYADINVVNCNMFDIDIEEIKNCHSTMTIFNGAIVYDEKA